LKTASSAVMPGMLKSATDPKLASAVPKCFSASEAGIAATPSMTGTSQ
jgi:hypothetical protein